ncbi:MAG: SGNH/GDSL hydrolase family protein [Planctomycetes bacterium]|nr:SGNH/GDSL hydrolase family protein [Planctomycetota bacterium]
MRAAAAAADGPRPRRRWWRRLLLILAAPVVALLAAEVALRWLGMYPPIVRAAPGEHADRGHPNFVAEPTVGWRMRPDSEFTVDGEGGEVAFRADTNGWRTRPAASPDLAARPRTVLLAGDSFVWGAGVQYDDSLAALLERAHPTVRVVNLAQPGFGLDQIMLAVVEQGLPLRPDLVVVGIYPQDCSRSQTAFREDLGFNKPTFALRGGELAALTSADRPSALGAFLEHNSRLFGLWRRAQRNLGFEHGIGSWWALNAAILDRLRSRVAAAGCPLLLAHVPLHDWRAFVGLTRYCDEHDVPLVDPVASHATKPEGIYYEPAGHFTPAGQRWFFELVNAEIARRGWL